MKIFITFILVYCLSSCIGASVNSPLTASHTVKEKLPKINVSDLEGKKIILPKDFKTDFNLIIFAFKHEQQKDVDPWLSGLSPLEKLYSNLSIIEMPTIQTSSSAFRLMVNNGMRSGITDPIARQRTQTLFIDKKPFLEAINISDETKVYPIIFSKNGDILFRTEGNYTQEKLLAIKNFLDSYK